MYKKKTYLLWRLCIKTSTRPEQYFRLDLSICFKLNSAFRMHGIKSPKKILASPCNLSSVIAIGFTHITYSFKNAKCVSKRGVSCCSVANSCN